jgi:hypothetical protein
MASAATPKTKATREGKEDDGGSPLKKIKTSNDSAARRLSPSNVESVRAYSKPRKINVQGYMRITFDYDHTCTAALFADEKEAYESLRETVVRNIDWFLWDSFDESRMENLPQGVTKTDDFRRCTTVSLNPEINPDELKCGDCRKPDCKEFCSTEYFQLAHPDLIALKKLLAIEEWLFNLPQNSFVSADTMTISL